jgi:aldose 1-epimerase
MFESVNRADPDGGRDAAPAPVSIAAGELVAEIIGGALLTVSSLRYQGVELLVDGADLPMGYRVHGERAGITLLHPWANRLGADEYEFGGVKARLDSSVAATASGSGSGLTRDANGLAIHGLIGHCRWRPVREGPSACRAALTWLGEPAFPFAHQILVRFAAVADGGSGVALRVSTSVAALTFVPVPVAFGWHPYFRCDRRVGAAIELPRLSVLELDDRGLPTGASVARGPQRLSLSDQSLDHAVAGLPLGSQMVLSRSGGGSRSGPAGPDPSIAVQFDHGYPCGQVFAPDDAPVVSLEPMTAPTDALRSGIGLAVAGSERPYSAAFTIRVG